MKDNKKETDFKANFFFANEEIEPFDAPQMCVVRRLSNAYHELKRSTPPARETEFSLKIAKLNFYKELIDRSIQTEFSPGPRFRAESCPARRAPESRAE